VEYVVLDVETTGLDCQKDQVIEIGAVRISQGVLCEEFSTLIKPWGRIPEEITELTGINDEMVQNMPSLTDALPQLEEFLKGRVIVGHNVQFDLSFLRSYIPLAEDGLDTVEMAKILFPFASGYSLGDLACFLGIEHLSAHRALGDARTTALLFIFLLEKLRELDLIVLETLFVLSQKIKSPLSDLICYEYGHKMRNFPGEGIKARKLYLSQDLKKGIFSAPPKEINKNYQLVPSEIAAFFQSGGVMETKFRDFKYRPQQEEMALQMAKCLNQGGYFVVEAGTGTGKSLAYLLPAVLWSTRSGHKMIVSTHTINLQEQLKNKDIPLAKEISGIDFSTCVIKGRSHYLCLRKWELFYNEGNVEIVALIMRLVIWLRETETGDIDELNLNKREKRDWQQLAAVSETCLGSKCRFFRSQCFVSRARKLAEQSDVIIVNHSLLLANAAANDNILPEYKYLVIDEAHHLEKVAETQFAIEINYYVLCTAFHKLIKKGNRPSRSLLDQLLKRAANWQEVDVDQRNEFMYIIGETIEVLEKCDQKTQEFFNIFSAVFAENWSEHSPYTQTVRILPSHRNENYWQGINAAGENLIIKLKELIKQLLSLGEKADLINEEYGIEINEILEFNMLSAIFKETVYGLEVILAGDEDNYVCWTENKGNSNFPSLHISPVEVKEQLYRYLFASKAATVLTSATLTVGGRFDYFIESIGLDLGGDSPKTLQLDSPFNYKENVLLGMATDLPDPGSASEILFLDGVAKALIKLIQAAQGRTVVLFTSHYQLKYIYDNIKLPLKKEGITVYAHGVTGSRTKILQDFKNKDNSVILGANSFWEGIDIVGQALALVVIVKLPFWSPTIPTVSARLDRYKVLNKDSFRRYSLPQAIIRFRQGFGRLIRSHKDYGAICILDKRIYQKNYGATFIKSLPKMKTILGRTDELADSIKDWLIVKTK
jgi:ATP-dependent DNA helicase DinG